ncbi:MAG TPA: S8 family serine peptidase, partial [Pyrinomonadaceae bacterium]|nr:S8 family serine peptidase [Pyrinomonadaceae bacterium]
MIFSKLYSATLRLAPFAMLACLLAAGTARAQSVNSAKISPDLSAGLRKTNSGKRVNAIVQFNRTPGRVLENLLLNLGGKVTLKLRNLNIQAVSLPPEAVEALAARDDVRYVSLDRPAAAAGHVSTTTGTDAVRVQTTYSLLGLIQTTTVYDGSGVGIAILDSGIDANHTSFKNDLGATRVVASQDFTGENRTDDPYGHGTHVASIAAGNDQISSGAYTGIASNARLVNLRVLNSQGVGTTSGLLAALDWVLTYRAFHNIRVVNLSLGTPAVDSYRDDPLCQAARRLVDAGVVVVAAAGNEGKDGNGQKIYGQIHSPGNEPSVITVGASNSFGTDARGDDAVTTYSSRGPTRSFWT